ncbi:aldo/keto reductase [soil metagenome]
MEYTKLNNGVEMPMLGYGVFLVSPQECERCVLDAISVGYRSIDTAQAYFNEEGVGNAIVKCGVAREDLFITTKVWITNAGYEKAKASIEESLQKLQTDYVDLLLVHQPYNDFYGTYRAMEEAYKQGKARAIGLSNFYAARFMDIAKFNEIKPAVNQLEAHVFHQRKEMRKYLERYDTKMEAWSSLARGGDELFTNAVLVETSKQHGKTPAQVALRFLIQHGVIVIPKSSHKERMIENFNIFDFSLTQDEMQKIEALDRATTLFMNHQDAEAMENIFARFKI